MGSIDEESVFVILEVIEGDIIYQFKREAVFNRAFPALNTKKIEENPWMRKKIGNGQWEAWINNDTSDKKNFNCVNDSIKVMFPRELSNYFFFLLKSVFNHFISPPPFCD